MQITDDKLWYQTKNSITLTYFSQLNVIAHGRLVNRIGAGFAGVAKFGENRHKV